MRAIEKNLFQHKECMLIIGEDTRIWSNTIELYKLNSIEFEYVLNRERERKRNKQKMSFRKSK